MEHGGTVPFLRAQVAAVQKMLAPFPLLQRLMWAVGWNTIGTLVGSGLTFVAMIAVARILGREAFGELGILQSTIAMFQCFAGLSIGMTATKHVAEYRNSFPERAGHIIAISDLTAVIIGVLGALLLCFWAPWLAVHSLGHASIAPLLRISSFIIAISALTSSMTGALSGMEEFRSITLSNLIVGLAAFPLILIGVIWRGTEGVVIALALQATFNCVLISWMAHGKARKHGIPITLSGAKEWSALWTYSLPAMLSGFLFTPVEWAGNAILVRTGGYAEMGLYSAALQWRNLLMFPIIMLTQAALPVFASVKGKHGISSDEYRRMLVLTHGMVLTVSLPTITFMLFCSKTVLSLYGQGFEGGDWTFAGVLFMVMINAITTGLGPAVDTWGHMWATFLTSLGWAITFLFLARTFVPSMHSAALGLCEAVAYILASLSFVLVHRRRIPYDVRNRMILAIFISFAVLFAYRLTPLALHIWLAAPMAVLTLILCLRFLSDHRLIGTSLKAALNQKI